MKCLTYLAGIRVGLMYLCSMIATRIMAKVVSYLFHPLSVLSYTLVILLLANPYVFGVNRIQDRAELIIMVIGTTFIIPSLAIILMRFLDLVDDLQLQIRLQRTGPYIAAGIFYAWMTKNLMSNSEIPEVFAGICMGCTLGIYISFVVNIKFKISLHALGAAAMISILIILYLQYPYSQINLNLPWTGGLSISLITVLFLAVILAGVIGTSRILLGVHKPAEVYWGYLTGMIMPFLGIHVVSMLT